MTKVKVVLFDVDGVLTTHGETFSSRYARERGVDYAPFRTFFQGEFQKALVGQADLKQLIAQHEDVWQTGGDIDGLLQRWFTSEDVRNEPLLQEVAKLRQAGMPCYLATNQEKYRGEYITNTMFKGEFDGYFVSGVVGYKKPSHEFFIAAASAIAENHPGVEPQDILFIDDSPEHIGGAREVGLNAHLYERVSQVRALAGVSD